MPKAPGPLSIVLLALSVGALTTVLALPWSRDMMRSRAVMPQMQPLLPPPDTLAIGHPRILDRIDAEEQLTNPVALSPDVLDRARGLFDTYCAVCHGENGGGAGPLSKYFRIVPDLASDAIQAYPDGLLYSVIREGGFNMPAYAESLDASERWALVHLIRSLRQP